MNTQLRIASVVTISLTAIVGGFCLLGLPCVQASFDTPTLPGLVTARLESRPAQAVGAPFLVKDIYSGITGSGLSYLTKMNRSFLFTANDGSHGVELWRSDGTSGGTSMVKDIYIGSAPSIPFMSSPYLTEVNGQLFFLANDGIHGTELWKSDGTESGTMMVKDIIPGSDEPGADYLTPMNGTLFFKANDGSHGWELWKSDGTTSGTSMVEDISAATYGSQPSQLTNVNGRLFFVADDGSHGRELWKSDGTPAGTVMVKDIIPGNNLFGPEGLTKVNSLLFFGFSGYSGEEPGLWRSDGTPAGTVVVSRGLSLMYLTDVNGTLFGVRDYHELWKSDGTQSGTALIRDIAPGNIGDNANVNGTFFFSAEDDSHGRELWKSDGTLTGTVMIKDICPGNNGSWPQALKNVNGTLFFNANDGSHGVELWRSDGTLTGTTMVADINPTGDSYAAPGIVMDDAMFFRANDGSLGSELWALALLPLKITQQADPNPVLPGQHVTYAIRLTNYSTGELHTIISDILPSHVVPTGILTWTAMLTAPGGLWIQTVVVTVETGYAGTLTNTVQATSDEGIGGEAQITVIVLGRRVYLPIVIRR